MSAGVGYIRPSGRSWTTSKPVNVLVSAFFLCPVQAHQCRAVDVRRHEEMGKNVSLVWCALANDLFVLRVSDLINKDYTYDQKFTVSTATSAGLVRHSHCAQVAVAWISC